MKRRDFLKGIIAFGASMKCAPAFSSPLSSGWISGVRFQDGTFGAVQIHKDLSFDNLFKSKVRLHGLNISNDQRWIVAPARRPGNLLFIFNTVNRKTIVIEAPDGYHFFGHGVFSPNGQYYITAQNDYQNEAGRIVIYDVSRGFETSAVYNSGGIGPHEIGICPKTHNIVVANGGILTHPETGRAKLNLDTMKPNLTRLDLKSGQIVQQVALGPENDQLSLRHLCVSKQGDIFVGAQDQGGIRPDKPLVWQWKFLADHMIALHAPEVGWGRMRGYIGSVALNRSENILGITSPRGHLVALWSLKKQTKPELISLNDVCGLAASREPDDFMALSGKGVVCQVGIDQTNPMKNLKTHPVSFDNHTLATI